MNILVFSWRDPKHPLAGGAEQVIHEHCKGWIKAGHKVTLFSSSINGLSSRQVIDGVEVNRGGHQYLGVQLAALFYYLKNKENFDFVIDQFHGIPFFTPLYVRKPKLAIIQEIATNVWFLNPLPWPLNWIIGIVGFLGEPLIFLLFYRWTPFMTGSQSAKEDVANFGIPKKNITIVPHGVIVKKHPKAVEKEKVLTIVYLGVLSKDKGIEDALRCFSLLDKIGNLQFWIIGKPEIESYGRKIRQLTNDLGLRNKIKFWGFVSEEKKFELLSRAHILVNPSVHEGWGLVNIEANSMGIPVVAYRSSGLIDSVKDGQSGILCRENTPVQLAYEIKKLLSDENKYKQIKKNATAWSKNFSWEKSQKLSLKLIESTFNQHPL